MPKAGWVRFRWSREVATAKSYRVTLDRAGRWHIAFAVLPGPIMGPGTKEVVGWIVALLLVRPCLQANC